MEMDVNFPKVVSTANYKAEGLIGNFPLQGKGIGNMTAGKPAPPARSGLSLVTYSYFCKLVKIVRHLRRVSLISLK